MYALNEHEEAILKAIRDYWDANGISPTIKEIGDAVGRRSIGMIHQDIGRLVAMGLVKRTPNIARSLVLLEKA